MRIDDHRHRGFECLCGNLRMASRALTQMYDSLLEPSGLTVTQLTLLWCVMAAEPVAMGEIAGLVVMDKTTVTRGIAGLASAGLVRVGRGRDARHRLVSSTVRGRSAFGRAMPAWHAAQRKAKRILGGARMVSLVRESHAVARAVSGAPRARRAP